MSAVALAIAALLDPENFRTYLLMILGSLAGVAWNERRRHRREGEGWVLTTSGRDRGVGLVAAAAAVLAVLNAVQGNWLMAGGFVAMALAQGAAVLVRRSRKPPC